MSSTVDAPEAGAKESGKRTETVETVVVRFCGDSGDGMQLVGTQMTNTSAVFGNDVSTLPDFPAEIRAPAGTLAGVSGYQLCFSNHDVFTPGDELDTLVAMNPAALKTNVADLKRGGTLIVNQDSFDKSNILKATYASNPLEDANLLQHVFRETVEEFFIGILCIILLHTRDGINGSQCLLTFCI